ncbi:MAG: bifunctional UDP-N-acetylglucosamine diphosphorylase/glucosamine-1-phosphate N-acetyltransferase GlmU [Alphaproteobacteria bacterium]|jgi:bifunctional UDP-N-acetylglucosamine pyrophosphorylase/glucosamine-1-phosphate N-acetyltransferase|nr:bifunctional UDP-N-acetylglucosamine diphosphorylase/glucosamine-1-phosphate N-acetyltransferase GlmU [Alphaproteobacteria bacterium]
MPESAVVILAAGKGTRMKTDLPKPLHRLAGRPMISHVLETVASLAPERTLVVAAPESKGALAEVAVGAEVVVQQRPLGTGDATRATRAALAGFGGDVVVLFADTPLLRPETLEALLAARRGAGDPAVAVLGFRPADPARYGRLVLDDAGGLAAIVELSDASEAERRIDVCNSGVMAVDGKVLFELLDGLGDDNAQGEFYLTDIVALARRRGRSAVVVEAEAEELMGIDSRAGLATAEAVMQDRLRQRAMAAGATLIDPGSVHLCHDTELGRDVVVHPFVVFGPGVAVDDRVEIHSFSHLEGCHVASGARIGPYARLRPGTQIGTAARIGNFVEVKSAAVAEGAKVNHLAYVGDAHIGAGANVGAGTITCNYDGFNKSLTEIGAGAFIGSNTALVAPVRVGDGAIVGAGSVITDEVPDDALATTRAPQKSVPDFAPRYRARKQARKAAAKAK